MSNYTTLLDPPTGSALSIGEPPSSGETTVVQIFKALAIIVALIISLFAALVQLRISKIVRVNIDKIFASKFREYADKYIRMENGINRARFDHVDSLSLYSHTANIDEIDGDEHSNHSLEIVFRDEEVDPGDEQDGKPSSASQTIRLQTSEL